MARPRNTDPSARASTAASVLAVISRRMRKAGKALAPPARLKRGLYARRLFRPRARRPKRESDQAKTDYFSSSPSLQLKPITSAQAHHFRPSPSLQAKHVEHVVQAGRPAAQPFRGAHRAAGVGHAALRADGELQALASAEEQHRVLADHVAAPDRVKADLLRRPLARV